VHPLATPMFVSMMSYRPLIGISPPYNIGVVWDKDELIRF